MKPPFNNIALSLSGGGTRAIGFHLGTLDYLSRVEMLPRVQVLSTVSGGSLIGTSYVLSLVDEISLQDLFVDFFEFLPKINMVEGLLVIMDRFERPVESGRRDLSTALAELYHERFFDYYFSDATFGALDGGIGDDVQAPQEIAFSATEFKTGIAFRFQKSQFDCKIGNGNVWLDPDDANEMRIADIVTASSCIPGGFAPLTLPDDFHWPATYRWGENKGRAFGNVTLHARPDNPVDGSVALMDGGVYDNQGITSVLLALSRRAENLGRDHETSETNDPQDWARWARTVLEESPGADLFIISDTPVRKNTFYSDDDKRDEHGRGIMAWLQTRRLRDLNNMAMIVAVLLVTSAGLSFFALFTADELDRYRQVLSRGLAGYVQLAVQVLSVLIPLAVAGSIGVLLLTVHSKLKDAEKSLESRIPKLANSLWFYIRNIRLGDIWTMLRLRFGSLVSLSSDIYMHRIRQLGYSLAFSHDKLSPTILANEIYTVTKDVADELAPPPECAAPSAEVRVIAEMSSTMPTKAWFDEMTLRRLDGNDGRGLSKEQLDDLVVRDDGSHRTDLDILVACGQLTMCYNLIRHIDEKTKENASTLTPESASALAELRRKACDDWNALQSSPFRLVDERLNRGRSTTHEAQIRAKGTR